MLQQDTNHNNHPHTVSQDLTEHPLPLSHLLVAQLPVHCPRHLRQVRQSNGTIFPKVSPSQCKPLEEEPLVLPQYLHHSPMLLVSHHLRPHLAVRTVNRLLLLLCLRHPRLDKCLLVLCRRLLLLHRFNVLLPLQQTHTCRKLQYNPQLRPFLRRHRHLSLVAVPRLTTRLQQLLQVDLLPTAMRLRLVLNLLLQPASLRHVTLLLLPTLTLPQLLLTHQLHPHTPLEHPRRRMVKSPRHRNLLLLKPHHHHHHKVLLEAHLRVHPELQALLRKPLLKLRLPRLLQSNRLLRNSSRQDLALRNPSDLLPPLPSTVSG